MCSSCRIGYKTDDEIALLLASGRITQGDADEMRKFWMRPTARGR